MLSRGFRFVQGLGSKLGTTQAHSTEMRILVANAFGSVVGGIESYLRDLIPALRSRGHAVGFLHEVPTGLAPPIDDASPSSTWCAGELGTPDALAAVANWCPDVVMVNGLNDVSLEERLAASHPSVLYAHVYYGTCATGEKYWRFRSSRACTRILGPSCLLLNYACGCGPRNPARLLAGYRLQVRHRNLLPRYRAVFVASEHMRDEFARSGVGGEVVVVNTLWPVGIEPAPAPPQPRPATGQIAFLGRLTRLKGAAEAITAVALASRSLGTKLRIVIGGDGPERARLKRIGARVGGVELLGWVDRIRRRTLLAGSDAVVVPSLWPEPFGLVGLEAASLGTPAVAFDTGGVREWLVPGKTGELAAPGSVTALSEALTRCLGSRHQELRVNAWNHARRFTRERHVRVLEGVLARVVSGREALS